MGRRGPPGKPPELQSLLGNPGHRTRHPAGTRAEPVPMAEIPVPYFVTTERERALFVSVASDAAARRILRSSDSWSLGRWACYMAMWEEACEHGQIRKDLERMMRGLEDRLGIGPRARQRLLNGVVDQFGS